MGIGPETAFYSPLGKKHRVKTLAMSRSGSSGPMPAVAGASQLNRERHFIEEKITMFEETRE